MPQKLEDNWNALPNLHKLQDDALHLVSQQLVQAATKYLAGLEMAFEDDSWVTIAELVIEQYPDLKANEPQFVIKSATLGRFGTIYGKKISIPDVLHWFNTYYKEYRLDYFADMREQRERTLKAEHDKATSDSGKTPEYYAQVRQKWLDKWKAQEEDKRRTEVARMAERTEQWRKRKAERDKIIQEIEKNLRQ